MVNVKIYILAWVLMSGLFIPVYTTNGVAFWNAIIDAALICATVFLLEKLENWVKKRKK